MSSNGHQQPVTIAVAGGKGGVGKTTVSANLAIGMAQRLASSQDRVAAVDLDLGSGNLNTCLGVAWPNGSINDFLFRRVDRLETLWNQTPLDNLSLICGSYQGSELVEVNDDVRDRLFEEFQGTPARAVLLDLGAGSARDVVDSFVRADCKVVVVAPESLSMHNGFLFMKSAVFQYLFTELKRERFLRPVHRKLQSIATSGEDLTLQQAVDRIKSWDRYSAYIIEGLLKDFDLHWVVNMYRGTEEDDYLDRFEALIGNRLGFDAQSSCLGRVRYDEEVRHSAQDVRAFSLQHPDSKTTESLQAISSKLVDALQAQITETAEAPLTH